MILFLTLFVSTANAEWELPFELNVHFLKRICGFSPLINSTYYPKTNVIPNRELLIPLIGSRTITTLGSALFSSNQSCLWDCFDSSSFPSPLSLQIDPVNASSECPPYSPNEPILPPIRLPSINPDGSCAPFDQHLLFHMNTSISCFVPFGNLLNPSKCDLIDTVVISFWSQFNLPDALCNCEKCTIPLVELNKTRNETDSECYVSSGIQLSITHQKGVINSFVIRSMNASQVIIPSSRERETLLADSSLSSINLKIDVRFYEYHPPSDTARFWSRRHHLWCPSEMSCLSEIWYPLSLLPSLQWESIVSSLIGAAIILIVMERTIRRSPNPSNQQIEMKGTVNVPY
uniref:Uncharacterized protein n=1 Tax=Pristionchus pacificus TaxID=54126 RepID=A0A8R1UW87_PRIPA